MSLCSSTGPISPRVQKPTHGTSGPTDWRNRLSRSSFSCSRNIILPLVSHANWKTSLGFSPPNCSLIWVAILFEDRGPYPPRTHAPCPAPSFYTSPKSVELLNLAALHDASTLPSVKEPLLLYGEAGESRA